MGSYGLVLQQLIEDGHLRVADSMVDVNNMPTQVSALNFRIIINTIIIRRIDQKRFTRQIQNNLLTTDTKYKMELTLFLLRGIKRDRSNS